MVALQLHFTHVRHSTYLKVHDDKHALFHFRLSLIPNTRFEILWTAASIVCSASLSKWVLSLYRWRAWDKCCLTMSYRSWVYWSRTTSTLSTPTYMVFTWVLDNISTAVVSNRSKKWCSTFLQYSIWKCITVLFTILNTTRSSSDAEEPCDAPQIQNIAHEKACNRGMILRTLMVITIAAVR